MVLYNFKRITAVPAGNDIIDIVLTRTQRKTPTVIRPGFKISRIRKFYMRKVKYTEETIKEKLGAIVSEFPRLDDIHPFYSALINVLYDKDYYKLALGRINTAKQLCENVSKDYVRLLKYGDSLYRCKQLKRAALGRMMTILKKLGPSLGFLEEVRKHLSRLPNIDPNTRTLILTGYPNVGKSSFMNKITRAEVEVQPYAFTTKSLYVGHTDFKDLTWQVIDTPGILDHPLADRNTIEMQAVTALAHLQSAVLYFLDLSQSCGYTLEQQVQLFYSIRPLFANKALFLVANKIDLVTLDQLSPEHKRLLEQLGRDSGAPIIPMSNESEEGVAEVKSRSCAKLLQMRIDAKLGSSKADSVLNRLNVTQPKPRDDRPRPAAIPESVMQKRSAAKGGVEEEDDEDEDEDEDEGAGRAKGKAKTQKEIQWEHGGPGVYAQPLHEHWDLRRAEWKTDIVPEIMDGKNIADFFDADIASRLDALEREEAALAAGDDAAGEEVDELDDEEREMVTKIRTQRELRRQRRQMIKGGNHSHLPRTVTSRRKRAHDIKAELEEYGVDGSAIEERGRPAKRRAKVTRELSRGRRGDVEDAADVEDGVRGLSRSRSRSAAARSMSRRAPSATGLRDVSQKVRAQAMANQAQRARNMQARKGEGDRVYLDPKPKHLFAGKSSVGTSRSR